jgi:hypothetical protein
MRKAVWLIVSVVLVVMMWQLHRSAALLVDTSAKWACQCRFIDGGDDSFCVAEDPLGLGMMSFKFSEPDRSVDTSVLGLYAANARYEAGQGCRVGAL